ncbi:MAG: sugar phosphate isomerase/epimerase [Calditrichaeota bacterium]|nr:sugar phosphate isomerase/epimerase [Calditrichota bacterium]
MGEKRSLSRREFLEKTAVGMAGVAVLGVAGCGKQKEAATQAGSWSVRLGMQSYSLRKMSVQEAIGKVHELGLRYIEIFPGHFPPDSDDAAVDELKALLNQKSVTFDAYGVVPFGADKEANRVYFEFAKKMGFKTMSADPSPDSFDNLDELVEEYGVKLAIHNHGPKSRYATPEDILKAVEGHHKWIGACIDTGHFLRAGVDPVEAVHALKDRLYGVHVKDWAGVEGEWPVFGEGKLDFVSFFRALKEVGFDGFCSIEYEAHPDDVMPYLTKCVEVTREAIAKAAA